MTLNTICLFKSEIFSGCYIGYAWRIRAKTFLTFKQIRLHSSTVSEYFSHNPITNCGGLINGKPVSTLRISGLVPSLK